MLCDIKHMFFFNFKNAMFTLNTVKFATFLKWFCLLCNVCRHIANGTLSSRWSNWYKEPNNFRYYFASLLYYTLFKNAIWNDLVKWSKIAKKKKISQQWTCALLCNWNNWLPTYGGVDFSSCAVHSHFWRHYKSSATVKKIRYQKRAYTA